MKVIVGAEEIVLGTTEATPTISLVDFSRRETDDFGVTRVVERGFARRLSVRLAIETDQVDTVQQQLASLRATKAQWVADEDSSWLNFEGFYRDFEIDLAGPALSFCTLTVEGLAELEAGADPGGDPAPPESASTLRLLSPIPVTGSVLVASSVVENDHPEWAPGTTYPAGARVIKAATHRIYESASAGNVGNDPAGFGNQWIDVGPTNRWAMFDQALGSLTSGAGSIVVTLGGAGVEAVALLDVAGATVRVQASAYDQTQAVGAGAILFFGLPATGQIIVTVAGPGQVSAGTLIIGSLVELGVTEASPTAAITDFSRKEADEFGEVTIVERAWAKRMSARALIRTDAIDLVANRVASVRARPSLWIGDDGLDSLTVYGFFRDFSIERGETVSKLSLSIEGLSTAGKIEPPQTSVAWPDVTDPDGTKPQDNADVTGENTSADTDKVGGTPAAALLGNVSQIATDIATMDAAFADAEADIAELFGIYGDTASAGASASAAAAYASTAQLARDIAARAAQQTLPSTFEHDGQFWNYSTSLWNPVTNTGRSLMADYPDRFTFLADAPEGRVMHFNSAAAPNAYYIGPTAVMALATGRTYRYSTRYAITSGSQMTHWGFACFNSDGAWLGPWWFTGFNEGAAGYISRTWTATAEAIKASYPNAAYIVPVILHGYGLSGVGNAAVVIRTSLVKIEDVTESAAATEAKIAAQTARGGAEAAQGAAVVARDTAQGHASTAATQATLSAQSSTAARNGAAAARPSQMGAHPDQFLPAIHWNPATASGLDSWSAVTFPSDSSGQFARFTGTSGYIHVRPRQLVPNLPGKKWRVLLRARRAEFSNASQASFMFAIGWYAVRPDFSTFEYITTEAISQGVAGYGSSVVPLSTTGWADIALDIHTTGAGWPLLSLGMYAFTDWAAGAYANPIFDVQILEVREVTGEVNAANSATAAAGSASSASTNATDAGSYATAANQSYINAQTQAGNALTYAGQANDHRVAASNSAAAAQSSATLAARMQVNALNASPLFSDNTAANGSGPTGWNLYDVNNAAQIIHVNALDNSGRRVPRHQVTSGNNGYFASIIPAYSLRPSGWYVLEADFFLHSGTLRGAGLYFPQGGVALVAAVDFFTTKDSSGIVQGAGVAGREYRYAVLIQAPSSVQDYTPAALYAITRWSGFGSWDASAADIEWHRCLVRPATQMEIDAGRVVSIEATVSTQASALATLNSQYASLSSTVSTQGASITTNSNALTTLNSTVASLSATVSSQGSSISTQASAITNLNNRTAAFWNVTAVAGGRAQLTVYADANGGAGIDMIGDIRMMGSVTIIGIVKANAFVADQGVDYAALVPGQTIWKTSAYDPTDYVAVSDTGVQQMGGSGAVTTSSSVRVRGFSFATNAGGENVDTNGDGFPDTFYTWGGNLYLYYRINGGSWVYVHDINSGVPGFLPEFTPNASGTIQFGWRITGYSDHPTTAFAVYERSFAAEIVNWK